MEQKLEEREDEQLFCYGHPDTPTRLRCSRCERPICGRCAIPASVGQHCPECVAEARRTAPKVRTALQATAPVVMAILTVTVASFVLQQVLPGYTFRLELNTFAVFAGEWWRLLTPVLVHGGVLHAFLNMYVLFIYGPNVEQAYGSARFLLIYLGSALAGSAFSFVFHPVTRSVGASGAIFGVAGALLVFLYNRRSSTFMAGYLRGLLTFLGINIVIGFLPGLGIDWLAHLGGLLGGALLGFGFDAGKATDVSASPARQLAAVAVVVGGSILLVATRLT